MGLNLVEQEVNLLKKYKPYKEPNEQENKALA